MSHDPQSPTDAADFYDDDGVGVDDDLDDDLDDLDFDCGERNEGGCQYAGSEWCDFKCPFHDEVFGLSIPSQEGQS